MGSADVTVDGTSYDVDRGYGMECLYTWENDMKMSWTKAIEDELIREDTSLASSNNIPKLRTLTREKARERGDKVYDEMASYLAGLAEFAELQANVKESGVWSEKLMDYLRAESGKCPD
jgi:hypothetical protein